MRRDHPAVVIALCVLAGVLMAVALLNGCGGGSSTGGSDQEVGGAQQSKSTVKSNDSITQDEGANTIETAQYPNGHDTDEESASGTKPIKPCSLVSRAQANDILGGGVKIAERLQGPTCVFTGSGREITLFIEEAPVNSIVRGARSARRVTVAGYKGWCLRYEGTSVVFGLPEHRLLQVTGPCAAGVRFAAAAIPRIRR